ncbi:hypothetical protein KC349_g314 [Hortaea werneckii]|nr:hypothetical protein KC349_g314 [Hortaea werneckii]
MMKPVYRVPLVFDINTVERRNRRWWVVRQLQTTGTVAARDTRSARPAALNSWSCAHYHLNLLKESSNLPHRRQRREAPLGRRPRKHITKLQIAVEQALKKFR